MGFVEAFEKTKLSWDKELKPYWKGGLNLEDVSDFMRKTKNEIDKSNLLFAFKYSTIPFLLIFILAFLLNAKYFGYLTFALLASLVLYSIINYYSHYQDFKLAKKYEKYVLTLHQHSVFIFLAIISPMINIYTKLLESPEKFQKMITFHNNESIILNIFYILLSIYLIIFGVFFSISSQKNYLSQIQKVKPFLKYLT